MTDLLTVLLAVCLFVAALGWAVLSSYFPSKPSETNDRSPNA